MRLPGTLAERTLPLRPSVWRRPNRTMMLSFVGLPKAHHRVPIGRSVRPLPCVKPSWLRADAMASARTTGQRPSTSSASSSPSGQRSRAVGTRVAPAQRRGFMSCPRCARRPRQGARFCGRCGADVRLRGQSSVAAKIARGAGAVLRGGLSGIGAVVAWDIRRAYLRQDIADAINKADSQHPRKC
jgi:hypothetical protein